MSKNNRRNNRSRNRQNRQNKPIEKVEKEAPPKVPEIQTDKNGLFHFSEEELSQDNSIRLISDTSPGETKFASFEDYLKARKE